MNKIAVRIDYKYSKIFNSINRIYKQKTVFHYAFFMNSKMYV